MSPGEGRGMIRCGRLIVLQRHLSNISPNSMSQGSVWLKFHHTAQLWPFFLKKFMALPFHKHNMQMVPLRAPNSHYPCSECALQREDARKQRQKWKGRKRKTLGMHLQKPGGGDQIRQQEQSGAVRGLKGWNDALRKGLENGWEHGGGQNRCCFPFVWPWADIFKARTHLFGGEGD